MSSPTRNRPHKGKLSPRATKHWRASFNGFVHSAPDSTLVTENLPANPDRNPFSLGKVKHLPSVQEMCSDAFCSCQASDSQIAINPRNYSATVWTLAQKSDVEPSLIEFTPTL